MSDITSTRRTSKLSVVFDGRHRKQDELHHCAMALLDPHRTHSSAPPTGDLTFNDCYTYPYSSLKESSIRKQTVPRGRHSQ